MLRVSILVLGLLIMQSCGEEIKEIPVYVLSKDKMAKVLAEKHIIDASINLQLHKRPLTKEEIDDLYKSAYKQSGIRETQFDSSFSYYKDNPEELNEVYDLVLNQISRKQAEAAK